MLEKELEILKQIEELYSGDISEQEFLEACKGKETKIAAWREAFKDYPLYEVAKAINHFYVKKSSKTRPNIAQLTAILSESGASKDFYEKPVEAIEPSFGLKYQIEDKLNGDTHWFVTDYLTVESLIKQDYWGWVYNIKNPSKDEFHRCMEKWCRERTGHKYRFYSDNDIEAMTDEQRDALRQKCRDMVSEFNQKKLN